ncbi:carotenoid oxygenase family protein [Roseateles amylovorans]|uniref:Carotenoid oxygenase family protein n=1 Tax=Roseateles amylovorans TaxID=2978473 RepID=A0ABY6ATQ9_9BURK|nr:carotenoid oxygenase family protein [Roseateles amylovorans]UXH76604.1 carotenoid oxygenase family protein [Roseateles amylovorans]
MKPETIVEMNDPLNDLLNAPLNATMNPAGRPADQAASPASPQRRALLRRATHSTLALSGWSLAQQALADTAHLVNGAAALSAADFERALAAAPELLPLRGWDGQDRATAELRIEGRWPRELQGTLYRNGPGLMSRSGERYRHWFDGDGLVHAWRFEAGRASHQARFVRTAKFRAEQEAGRFLLPTLGTAIPPQRPVVGADSLNVANTSVLRLGGRLHALWEGGSAYELDADTLDTVGPRAWDPALRGMPFSAHPKVEADGTVWNFGSTARHLTVYRFHPDGVLAAHQTLALPMSAMVHDFAVSQRFLVFLLAPLTMDLAQLRAGASMTAAMRWQPEQGTRVLILDKATLTPRWAELPASMVFHFGNAWDEGDDLVLDYVEAPPLPEFNQRIAALMAGRQMDSAPSQPRVLRLSLSGGAPRLERRDEAVEFPVVDPRVVGQRHRFVYYPTRFAQPHRWGFDGVMRLDLETGARQRFQFDEEVLLEEQLLVPRPGSSREGQGWLLGLGYDVRRQRSFATVFDAERLGDGPLARAWLPYWVPLGFHGRFYAA